LDHIQSFAGIEDGSVLAQAIVDTVREPLIVLDHELRVIAASRAFYMKFKVNRDETQGQLLYALGDGQWDIPKLRLLLERIIPEQGVMEDYEVEHEFPQIGRRAMLLNARKVFYEAGSQTNILLGIEDITEKHALAREKDELLRQKDVLLDEMQHRIANSLQIIASILLLKARTVQSEETRLHLQDAHKRVMSVASVQQHLHASGAGGPIQVGPYLSKLCEALAQSIIGDNRAISLKAIIGEGTASSSQAVSLGLIVTELVINALKHAFPEDTKHGQVTVAYAVAGTNWTLSVSDNGIGRPEGTSAEAKTGLGTTIVKALAHQLDARVEIVSGSLGTTVSLNHPTFEKKLTQVRSDHSRTASTFSAPRSPNFSEQPLSTKN
jgi:two-component sensor histidine kinase